ncbi:MAG: O-methyltransferase [Pyrinomonadaceae bacterium]|nr:O-methyltransferase [Pyrinomonadaceae bacterium]MCX7640771.1 O-methyltransferase [Pyrinomonadaceae bacterium]MDW8304666.1 O-methyltransferase [Acidobacteriota bacterium]
MIVDRNIEGYATSFTSPESEILKKIRRENAERKDFSMLSGFYQGRILAFLSKLIRPRRILEIGTYLGYSALCLAEGLAEDGKLFTIDIDPTTHEKARHYWAESNFADKIIAITGNALQIIPTLDEVFDLVFIDADKVNYSNYYDAVFSKLKIGGIILADNVLWSGKVLDFTSDEEAAALHKFNQKVQSDTRTFNVLLTVRDGLMMIRKEKE